VATGKLQSKKRGGGGTDNFLWTVQGIEISPQKVLKEKKRNVPLSGFDKNLKTFEEERQKKRLAGPQSLRKKKACDIVKRTDRETLTGGAINFKYEN